MHLFLAKRNLLTPHCVNLLLPSVLQGAACKALCVSPPLKVPTSCSCKDHTCDASIPMEQFEGVNWDQLLPELWQKIADHSATEEWVQESRALYSPMQGLQRGRINMRPAFLGRQPWLHRHWGEPKSLTSLTRSKGQVSASIQLSQIYGRMLHNHTEAHGCLSVFEDRTEDRTILADHFQGWHVPHEQLARACFI